MKIAVVMIGFLENNYEESFNNIKEKLLKDYNYELFIHTWNKISLNSNKFVNEEDLKNTYKTNNIIIEKQDKNIFKNSNHKIKSFPYQFYSLKKIYDSFNERLNNFDYIVKIRPDIRFKKNINLIFDNEINFFQTNLGGGLDVFFYGNVKVMIKTFSSINNFNTQIKKYKKPEMIYLDFWNYNNVKFKKIGKFMNFILLYKYL